MIWVRIPNVTTAVRQLHGKRSILRILAITCFHAWFAGSWSVGNAVLQTRITVGDAVDRCYKWHASQISVGTVSGTDGKKYMQGKETFPSPLSRFDARSAPFGCSRCTSRTGLISSSDGRSLWSACRTLDMNCFCLEVFCVQSLNVSLRYIVLFW